ncbi:MAG: ribosome maturation factor RimM [Chloroflexota bacterium]
MMANSPNPSPKYLLLGQVTRPHGVRGELRIRILTDYPERIGKLQRVFTSRKADDKQPKPYVIEGMRMNKGHGLLRLEDINDRDTADRLRQHFILVSVEDAVPLGDDEFYLYQVLGMQIETGDGLKLGTIKDIIETGANDVYVVDSPTYGEVLFPITPETLIEHDIDNGVVYVNLIDGILPEAPPKK